MEKAENFYWKLFKSTFIISAFTVGGGFVIIPLLKAKHAGKFPRQALCRSMRPAFSRSLSVVFCLRT